MGDFNYPGIDWENNCVILRDHNDSYKLMEGARESFLYQHVTEPTHHRADQNPNVLDLVFRNEEGMVHNLEPKAPIGKSNHQVITFDYMAYSNNAGPISTRSLFSKGDYESMEAKLCDFDFECLDEMGFRLDSGYEVDVAYLDFAKAFDSVSHKHLLVKLHAYGIQGKLLAWITEYLQRRKQRVSVNGTTSNWVDVVSGIQQGSVIGPVFFAIFVNDLTASMQCLPSSVFNICKTLGHCATS